jgi:hypothetical protein
LEHGARQIDAFNFRTLELRSAAMGRFGPESQADARLCAAGAPCALIG